MKKIAIAALLSAASASTLAQGGFGGGNIRADSMYASLSTGRTTYETYDVKDRAWNLKGTIGMDLDRNFAVEGSATYFGNGEFKAVETEDSEISAWTIGGAGVLKHPVSNIVTLTVKAGLEFGDVSYDYAGEEYGESTLDLFYGIGMIARFHPEYSVTAGWESHGFAIDDSGFKGDVIADVFVVGIQAYF